MKVTLLPIHDSPSPISWLASDEDIRAGSKIFYFLLFPQPEHYPFAVTMLIQSEKLYRGGTASSHELELPSEDKN
jgi:hypothetical protein